MKKTIIIFALAGAAFIGVAVASEEAPQQHKQWMKDLGNQMGAMRKGVDVEKNAAAMEAIMKEVDLWWRARNSDIANKGSKDSIEGAAMVAKAAQTGDKAGISAGMKLVAAGCKGCHDNHREKVSENVYKIK